MTKPSLPQGTRDFGPDQVRRRQYIFGTIRSVFERYGFQPLETPAMENLDTLMGKYGEEGDKLIFKILNNGLERPEKHEAARADLEKVLEGKNVKGLTERALRYDLTIPFARYVAMNHGQLTFPFRRYQVQPVWRADRPQRGRYREFYQCDADVVGSRSLLNEADLAHIYHDVFTAFGLKGYELRINSRKVLTALAELCGGAEKMTDISMAIDKLDKIGLEKVKEELATRGLSPEQVTAIERYLAIEGTNEEKLAQVKALFAHSETGQAGIAELEFLLSFGATVPNEQQPTANGHQPAAIPFLIDLTLARGLNYYTGLIFEVRAPKEVKIGSIGGGGRYDDLTGLFGLPNIPGVGISFGVDRIYDVLEELQLFPASVAGGTQVLFFHLGATESRAAWQAAQLLRGRGIAAEVYPETAKMDRQFKYADKKGIPFAAIIGTQELQEGTVQIKDLRSGKQERLPLDGLGDFLFI